MLLDDIIKTFHEGEDPQEHKEGPQGTQEPSEHENTRIKYSDEFYARFQKPNVTTAPEEDDCEA